MALTIDRITKTGLETHHVMLMVVCSDVKIQPIRSALCS